MKPRLFVKYGLFSVLSLLFITTGRLLSAQGIDSVKTTPVSTVSDTLPETVDSISAKNIEPGDTGLNGFQTMELSINWDSLQRTHSPRRAGLYSAVFPGLGQIYNRQYIKVPFMWAGIGVATGIFIFNFNHYTTFRDAYRLRLNGKLTDDPQVNNYSLQDLKYLRDGYRQYVDYSVLGFAAVYLYNILDAVVFGYLYDFDVASPLSKVRFGPVWHGNAPYVGFGITYHF